MAGQALILNHFLNKGGIKSKSYYVQKNNGINEYYDGLAFANIKVLLRTVWREKFDIAHIHSAEILVPFFKLLGKKVILHYHGSDINMSSRKKSTARRICRNTANLILYNDTDMTIPTKTKCIYFPDIIDTDLFRNNKQPKSGGLIIVSNNLNTQKTIANVPKSVILQDVSNKRIPYSEMPDYLSQFETYYDEKVNDEGQKLNALSNTGLQALACGLVVKKGVQTFTELPSQFKPKIIIKRLENIYEKL